MYFNSMIGVKRGELPSRNTIHIQSKPWLVPIGVVTLLFIVLTVLQADEGLKCQRPIVAVLGIHSMRFRLLLVGFLASMRSCIDLVIR